MIGLQKPIIPSSGMKGWVEDTSIVAGLVSSPYSLDSPCYYYHQPLATHHFLVGEYTRKWKGYKWDGSQWVTDYYTSSGLGTLSSGNELVPSWIKSSGTYTYMIVTNSSGVMAGYRRTGTYGFTSYPAILTSEAFSYTMQKIVYFRVEYNKYVHLYGASNGYTLSSAWTGSAWSTASGSPHKSFVDTGINSYPALFAIGADYYVLLGGYGNTFKGYKKAGGVGYWLADSEIETNIVTTNSKALGTAFYIDGNLYFIHRNSDGSWKGYRYYN